MPSSATSRVQKATSSQLLSPDMIMNRDICDAINSDPWLAKDFVKAVKKRLQNKNSKVQLFSLTRSGVEFPKKEADSSIVIAPSQKTPLPQVGFGVPITTIERLREVMTSERDHFSSSGLDNIRSASELFSRMLQTLNPEGFKGKKGEVVSDLADRCLSHKKRLMQLINSTKNHGLLLEALTLNDQLEVVLAKYDALASSLALPAEDGEDEEEDGFSIIAKRNTTYNSTGGDEAKRPTEGFSSVSSHALVPFGPPATATTSFKVEESLPWKSNQSAQKTSNPFSGSESWEQYHSYPQTSLMPNQGYNPYHSCVAPWALPAMANSPWTDMDVASNPFLSTTTFQFSSS
ncbi:hypothetical protein HPP92_017925 [Vanilla planifolia]|uniref:GAT domain-containing protein n=1 Tax=Vanilla planifolia TaxID=51239 RepID=A0A835UMV1_VANPL|nr:hypothetical protein HPP92_017925 [Vanilla planifolia]